MRPPHPAPSLSAALAIGLALLATLGGGGAVPAPAWASAETDAYLRGYAAATLDLRFGIRPASLALADGVVRLRGADLAGADAARVRAALAGIPGVTGVEIAPAAPAPRAAAATALATAAPDARDAARRSPSFSGRPTEFRQTGFPEGYLFDALLADPRWPHFSAAGQRYVHDPSFRDIVSVSFGETIPFYRLEDPATGRWELGLQAAVFAIFDMDSDSHDLVNADYFLAPVYLAYQIDEFQALARVFHQSSHLGDEFLLRSHVDRVNLSYEAVDVKLSYRFLDRLVRVYGGAGYLFDQDPAGIKPWFTQVGVEVRGEHLPFRLLSWASPVAAVDLQQRQENGWSPDLSVRAGLQLERPSVLGRRVLLTLEYFRGHSPNGQFYKQAIDYFGVGVHFHYQ